MKELNHIPQTKEQRMMLRRLLQGFVQQKALCPPLALHQLEELAAEFVATKGIGEELTYWLMVEINNQLWLPVVAGIPQERRLLMLPKCLSKFGECRGEYDEFGLLCHRCGRCLIPSLQDRAEELGTLSIVAEGFTQVIELIQNQVVDAVIGVSCLDSLEKAFPLLVRHAVPGLAIALNDAGCRDTHVDEDYVEKFLAMIHDQGTVLLNHEHVREQVSHWFGRKELAQLMSPQDHHTQQVCLDWMCGEGKRWRPYLLAAVWQALTGKSEMPEDVHRAAVAVECFHKASLIHDDIEDHDDVRYGRPTVNALYGDAFAINAGDALLGEGYRILAETNRAELVRLIADAHIRLCKGQGVELLWTAQRGALTLTEVVDIFRNKTVPAFEVALLMGQACTGDFTHLTPMLRAYSEALGIAYQMKDDLDDFVADNEMSHRPSAVMALRNEHPEWTDAQVRDELVRLIGQYHQMALDALTDMRELELKRLLYQVINELKL